MCQDWIPPGDPDPHAILNEARADYRAGEYANALVKHEWFHEEALSIEPALSGVRLSFALHDWYELAKQYPPAMQSLAAARDRARQQVLSNQDAFRPFSDYNAICKRLGEWHKTVELFVLLDSENPGHAARVYGVAQDALVKDQQYDLCGKYIDAKKDLISIIEVFKLERKYAQHNGPHKKHRKEFCERRYTNDSAILVALLVKNDRSSEAHEAADEFKKEWDDEAFHEQIDQALEGVVPAPWP